MKNDRETKNSDAAKQGQIGDILPYEKPRLESVSLFADQVLGDCGKVDPGTSSCVTPPTGTGSPANS